MTEKIATAVKNYLAAPAKETLDDVLWHDLCSYMKDNPYFKYETASSLKEMFLAKPSSVQREKLAIAFELANALENKQDNVMHIIEVGLLKAILTRFPKGLLEDDAYYISGEDTLEECLFKAAERNSVQLQGYEAFKPISEVTRKQAGDIEAEIRRRLSEITELA